MRRYIIHVFGYDGCGYLVGTFDSLDDIIGDEETEAIDTHTGDMYYYRDGVWVKDGNADDVKPLYLRRKSDPPIEPREVKEVEGGMLVPPGFRERVLAKALASPKWFSYSVTISGADLQIPALEKE